MDLYISEFLFDSGATWARIVSAFAKFPGYAAIAVGIGLLIYGFIKKRDGDVVNGAYLISGVCLTALIVLILKESTDRMRFADLPSPEAYYRNMAFGMGGDSFPSGHTAMAACGFLFAPLLSAGKKRASLNAALCVWVAATALARITLGAHYFTDTAAAIIIALLIKLILGYFILNKGYLKSVEKCKSIFKKKRRPA